MKQKPEKEIVTTMIRTPASLHYGLRRLALDKRTTFNSLVQEALESYWNKRIVNYEMPER